MQWVPVGLIYLALAVVWVAARRSRDPSGGTIATVLASLSDTEQDRIAALARDGKVIEAIKALRATVVVDLKTAKATVEGLAIFRPAR